MSGTEETSLFCKMASAVFFGCSSILAVFINKILLTNYELIRLYLPMFTVLRRASLTSAADLSGSSVHASFGVKVSVFMMIAGSFIAALYDLTFDTYGYTLIFLSDIATAAYAVFVKQKLEAKDFGTIGLMYYNCLFMLLPVTIIAALSDDYQKVVDFVTDCEGKVLFPVVLCFLMSCVCGFTLNYSQVLCTKYNSALTTTCVGPIKNLFVTYVGMISSGDYVFQWTNFIGINVSTLGSIIYTYMTFKQNPAIQAASKERIIVLDSRLVEKQSII